MIKIRLQRIGRRHQPHFRVVVTDAKRGPKSANFIEIIGSYNAKAGQVTIDDERAKYWLSVGAQPSTTVRNFLIDEKVIDGKKVNALPKKTPIIKEKELEEEKSVPKKEETQTEEEEPKEAQVVNEVEDVKDEKEKEPEPLESKEEPISEESNKEEEIIDQNQEETTEEEKKEE